MILPNRWEEEKNKPPTRIPHGLYKSSTIFPQKKKVNTLHIPTWFIHVHTTSTIFPHFSTTKNMANPKSPMVLRRSLARRLRSPAPGYLWGSGSPPGQRSRSRCRPPGLSSPPRSPWPPGCWIPGWR